MQDEDAVLRVSRRGARYGVAWRRGLSNEDARSAAVAVLAAYLRRAVASGSVQRSEAYSEAMQACDDAMALVERDPRPARLMP